MKMTWVKIASFCFIAVALSSMSSSASAASSGYTAISNWGIKGVGVDNVCVNVTGGGLRVGTVTASFVAPAANPCNPKLYITFFDLNNKQYDQKISPLHNGCTGEREYKVTYNKDMRPGRVCGAVSIDGSLKPGACVSIHK